LYKHYVRRKERMHKFVLSLDGTLASYIIYYVRTLIFFLMMHNHVWTLVFLALSPNHMVLDIFLIHHYC